jgi:hypothetical protein
MVAAELRQHQTDAVIGIVDFLLDTGADWTSISVDDAELRGIYDLNLAIGFPPYTRGIGGTVPLRYLSSVTLVFHGPENEEPATWQPGRLAVLYPDEALRGSLVFHGSPSLLGRDFLQHCRLEINRADPVLYFGI